MEFCDYAPVLIAMKKMFSLVLIPLLAAPALLAQAPAEPASSFGLAPSAPPEQPPGSPASLMPEGLPPLDKSPLSKGEKNRTDKTAIAEDALRKRIKLREIKTKALRDPAIQAEWEKSLAARTDYEKRAIMTNYYNLLFDRMLKIDATLKTEIDALRDSYISDVTQKRVAPTEPPKTARSARN
jgi:hypothetical protein